MKICISEINGKDWAVVSGWVDGATESREAAMDAARESIESRRAQGLGYGPYEIVIDGETVAKA